MKSEYFSDDNNDDDDDEGHDDEICPECQERREKFELLTEAIMDVTMQAAEEMNLDYFDIHLALQECLTNIFMLSNDNGDDDENEEATTDNVGAVEQKEVVTDETTKEAIKNLIDNSKLKRDHE